MYASRGSAYLWSTRDDTRNILFALHDKGGNGEGARGSNKHKETRAQVALRSRLFVFVFRRN
jgi:hypothetical protein